MSGGGGPNGADIGAVYTLLREVAGQVSSQSQMLASHGRMLVALNELVTSHGQRLTSLERGQSDLRTSLQDLRQTVVEYHASVLRHGIMISELEDRVRRIERHLELPPIASCRWPGRAASYPAPLLRALSVIAP